MAFTDRDGQPREVPDPPSSGSRYGEIGAFQGPGHYERNAFAQGTVQEIEALVGMLDLRPGERVLDVGCATGRHVRVLTELGFPALGLDLSESLLRGVPVGQAVAGDARRLPLRDGAVDVVLSLCQGGFGLAPAADAAALAEMSRVLRPGGKLALTAFSLVFAARYLDPEDALDAEQGLHHRLAEVRGPDGARAVFDLWSSAYSAGHLRLLAQQCGLTVMAVHGVEPGAYAPGDVLVTSPEILVLARKPAD